MDLYRYIYQVQAFKEYFSAHQYQHQAAGELGAGLPAGAEYIADHYAADADGEGGDADN